MMSFCVVPWRAFAVDAVLLRHRHVQREQPGRRRVDRHGGVHLVERDAVEERVHVALVGDRHADLADLAAGELVVGVVARLGGQIEGHRQPRLALCRGCGGRARSTPAPTNGRRRCASPTGDRARGVGVPGPFTPRIVRSEAREQADRRDAPGPGPCYLRLRAGRRDRGSGPVHGRGDAAGRARAGRAARAPAHPHPPGSRRSLRASSAAASPTWWSTRTSAAHRT